MRRPVIIILLLIFISACGKKSRVPSGILPPDKMQTVVSDLMKIDHFLNNYVFTHDTVVNRKMEILKMYQQVFKLHAISKESFNKSFIYYRDHPALLKEVMDSLGAVPDYAPVKIMEKGDTSIRLQIKKRI